MKAGTRKALPVTLTLVFLAFLGATLFVKWRFDIAMQRARAHAAQGSVLLHTRCGAIKYQEAGRGVPLLAVHGSGGGIRRAAVVGGSAGAPSALQMALRHPDRVSALVLLVPLAYKPPTQADSPRPRPARVENLMMQMIGSDFLFWAATHIARNTLINTVLATPPELLNSASQIPGARFVGFDQGGHTWVGHNDEVMDAIRSAAIGAGPP